MSQSNDIRTDDNGTAAAETVANPSQQQQQQQQRHLQFSSRDNSEFKWRQNDPTVLGALEVPAEPTLNVRAKHYPRHTTTIIEHEDDFKTCLLLWKELNLQDDFVKAYESMPVTTECCGMVTDIDGTIKHNVPLLNATWAKHINDTILAKQGYRLSIVVWSWSNPTGKAETVIPMIRFHSLKFVRNKTRAATATNDR